MVTGFFLGIFFILTGAQALNSFVYDRQSIPDAPDIAQLSVIRETHIQCGTKIQAQDVWGRPAVFYVRQGSRHPIKIATAIDRQDFEAWVDSDGDGVFDRYYFGFSGADMLLMDYPDPCALGPLRSS